MPTEVLSLGGFALLGAAYLSLLFVVAWLVERRATLRAWARHPAAYALSLGVYASTWTYFGSVGFAKRAGLAFLAIYLGPTLAALFAPTSGARLVRLTRDHQLSSLADLFAFRYRSRAAGTLVTLAALFASLPYIALQIRAVVSSLRVLAGTGESPALPIGLCLALVLFAVLFGAREASSRGAQDGLVAAIALESLVKLIALLAVGATAIFGALGGIGGMQAWVVAHPDAVNALQVPVREGSTWTSLVLVAFAASFLLPRQFHVAFAEGATPAGLRTAAWAFPLYLLVLNLPIIPIVWAGTKTLGALDPDLYVLGIAQSSSSPFLIALAFVGGVSAASAMVIVTALALSSMALNHLVLLVPRLGARRDLYAWLVWARRALVFVIVFAGYGTTLILEERNGLVDPGVVSFVAFAQFLPGIVGVLFWARATRHGFVAGLVGGLAIWGLTSLVPLLVGPGPEATRDPWTLATFGSLSANALLFVVVSLRTSASPEERDAAEACVRGTPLRVATARLTAERRAQIRDHLVPFIGEAAAQSEMARAVAELGGAERLEAGPFADRLERNLTAIVGPLLSRIIVAASAREESAESLALAHRLRMLDERMLLEGARLHGLAAELDRVRRYLRTLLDDLPLGACALEAGGDIVLWNRALERLTGLPASEATGRALASLAEPWGATLRPLAARVDAADVDVRIVVDGAARALRVHTSRIQVARDGDPGGVMLLIEDVTERRALQAKLGHQDRLTSLGRLAAGVAHEIGNPLTGIACVAQNLRDDGDPALARERIEDILEQTRRIESIVTSLLAFSHPGSDAPARIERLRASDLADEALRLVRLGRAARAVACVSCCAADHEILGDRRSLLQVIVNLLNNACDASRPEQRVTIESAREPGRVRLRVRDDGCGIPPDVRARLFDPFVTTKPPGSGTGLGLSVVYGIVHEHGGTIDVDSHVNQGTTIDVWLPAPAVDAAEGRI